MIRIHSPFFGLLSALAVTGIIAAFIVGTGSADVGRTLTGVFCTDNHTCMALTLDDGSVFTGKVPRADPAQPDVTLRPGTYWITVTDNSDFHNFSWRSCPGSTDVCTAANPASGGEDEDITPICNEPLNPVTGKCPNTNPLPAADVITVTKQVVLKHGTYRLFCDAPNHEAGGMYVEIAVGGVGQVG
jgi:hypothetical protein